MKKNLMKKVFAVSLSIAMACSFVPASNPVTASAAAPYVSLRTAFKTLKVNGINTMTLKNNTIDWKITKVATSDKKIAMVYNRTEESFRIKGKSVGRATVKARLKTTARKKQNSKLVSCRVNVIEADTPVAPTSRTVETQDQLIEALADKSLTAITIATTTATNFNIPEGTYDNVALTVNAPNSDITNAGTFKSIDVQAIKAETWFENAVGNAMRFLTGGRLVVGERGKLASLAIAPTTANADLKLEVNGEIGNVVLSAQLKLTITGTPKAKIKITVESGAKGSDLSVAVPADLAVKADANITMEKGSEGSTVEVTEKGITASIVNNTDAKLDVKRADGTTISIAAGGKMDVNTPADNTTNPVTPVNPSNPNTPNTGNTSSQAVSIDLDSLITASVVSPAAVTGSTTTASIKIDFSKAINYIGTKESGAVSGSAIEYKLGSGSWTKAMNTVNHDIEVGSLTVYNLGISYRITAPNVENSASRTITIKLDLSNK